tara:strand:- start:7371 stop:7994 length:624 start_codon:yes stop_codon:yes gene_type:complete
MHNHLYIFGERSTALEIYYSSKSLNFFSKIYFVVHNLSDSSMENTLEYSDLSKNININNKSYFIASMTNTEIKKKCINIGLDAGLELTSIISPTAYICESASIGLGVYVAPKAVISSRASVSDNCIINCGVTVGHDVKIEEFSSLNPGVVIGGNSIIGENVLIGANSVIKQGLRISKNSKIDAMTYIYFNLKTPSACTSRNTKLSSI